jgi:DNA-binding transcriptional regulator YiaG
MFSYFAEHEYMPCEECGASVHHAAKEAHVCDEGRRLDFQKFRQLRSEIALFEDEFTRYLGTPEGRFHAWYAERERRRAA